MTPQPNPPPKLNTRYGAPMGRPSADPRKWNILPDTHFRMYLQRVPLDSGGYDRGGAYWGLGAPLYYFEYEGLSDISGYIRAGSRESAKKIIREEYPHAKFFR